MQRKRLDGRIAVITGGSRGIGRGIACTFAKEGADIAFSYLSNEKAANLTKKEIEQCGVSCLAIKADSSQEKEIKHMADLVRSKFGGINILINNAGAMGVERAIVDNSIPSISGICMSVTNP